MTDWNLAVLHGAIFIVAILYSSVGHGGASGYLAVLSLFSFPKDVAVPSALGLNILVASTAFLAFRKAGYFDWELIWPFLIGSIPAAFLGGTLRISSSVYSLILSGALCLAAIRMWLEFPGSMPILSRRPSRQLALLVGFSIGLVSGMIGIGGGVFLSPLLLLLGWADAKQTAASSAMFILANSVAALGGHLSHSFHALPPFGLSLVASAFMGGWLGSRVGAGYLSHLAVRRALSLVLWTASIKLIQTV